MNPQEFEGSTYLFGAGGAASWVLHGFRREGIAIAGFLDDDAVRIAEVGGLPVYRPDDVRIPVSARQSATVVCAVMNPLVDEVAIMKRLLSLGWRHVHSLGTYGRLELGRSGRRCGMLDGMSLELHREELQNARLLLADDHSRGVFDGFIAFCRELDDTGFPAISPNPYFPTDLPRWAGRLRMIDCGAFDGDSVRAALSHGYFVEASISFEPDPVNYRRLASNIHAIGGAMAWPCGVSDRTQTLRFSAQGDTGSAVSESGGVHVQCVSLDDAVPHFAPNLVKLDIEGSEEAALRGAERIIRTHRPGLAVSVYHLPTDIWRIPLFLSATLGANTRFFLRRHSRTIADTVLYVFPDR